MPCIWLADVPDAESYASCGFIHLLSPPNSFFLKNILFFFLSYFFLSFKVVLKFRDSVKIEDLVALEVKLQAPACAIHILY